MTIFQTILYIIEIVLSLGVGIILPLWVWGKVEEDGRDAFIGFLYAIVISYYGLKLVDHISPFISLSYTICSF